MAFGEFETLEEVLRKYQIAVHEQVFVQPIVHPVEEHLRTRLNFFKSNAPLSVSEEAICEFLIAPILQEMWLAYVDSLTLWSHAPFGTEKPLSGYPDYFFSRRSPLGRVREQPYVLFVEAKRDNFDKAWGQCLAAMLAAQSMNQAPEQPIYGGVSNGEVWYFGKLQAKTLIQDPRAFTLTHLDELFAALRYVFEQAKLLSLSPGQTRQVNA